MLAGRSNPALLYVSPYPFSGFRAVVGMNQIQISLADQILFTGRLKSFTAAGFA